MAEEDVPAVTSAVSRAALPCASGGRPGQGTFITATAPAVPPEAQQGDLLASLEAWLRAADEAGLDDEAVTALIAVARRDLKRMKERVE